MTNSRRALLAALPFTILVAGCDLVAETAPGLPAEQEALRAPDAFGPGTLGAWSPALDIEAAPPGADANFNTGAAEGCPFISRDGKTFFIASDRPGGMGGLDIWIATRERVTDPWGAPENAGYPINTPSADFCPTLARDGHTFFFASNRPASPDGPGYCGTTPNADLYESRWGPDGFRPPTHLGCEVNSPQDEHGPFLLTLPGEGPVLYFSSARSASAGDASGDHDLYVSRFRGGAYGAPELVPGVNTMANDGQPNVRRDGLELFFYSNRPGSAGNDIYSASRTSPFAQWTDVSNLGPNVNSNFSETRPTSSWDGRTLYFGSTRQPSMSNDIYLTTR